MSLARASRLTGVPWHVLRRYIREGRLPCFRANRRILVAPLDARLAEQLYLREQATRNGLARDPTAAGQQVMQRLADGWRLWREDAAYPRCWLERFDSRGRVVETVCLDYKVVEGLAARGFVRGVRFCLGITVKGCEWLKAHPSTKLPEHSVDPEVEGRRPMDWAKWRRNGGTTVEAG